MTESKWTAGPWCVGDEKKVSEIWNVEILGQQGYSLVSTCYGTTTGLADWYAGAREVKANAHLIAAAPDLYEALEGIIAEIDDCAQPSDWDNYVPALAALAKSRGE